MRPTPDLTVLFQALADRTRLRLLNLMRDSEICVCFFVEVLEASQPKISRHLAYLRKAGLVSARREGKWMHYRLLEQREPAQATILRAVLDSLVEDRQMQKDRAALEKACCAPKLPTTLQNAPRPSIATR